MDTFFLLAVLAGVLVGVLIAAIVVLILHIRTNSQINRLTYPAYEYAIKKAEHDADRLLREAQEQARSVIAKAEETGQATIRTYDEEARQMHERYQEALTKQGTEMAAKFSEIAQQETHKLHEAIGSLSQSLTEEHNKAISTITRVSNSLEAAGTEAETHAKSMVASLNERMDAVSSEIEASLKAAQTDGLKQISTHFASLSTGIEEEVAAYSAERKKLLDAHIERLVEDVVTRVLQVELPVSTHASLARKALEEAKAKHIL